MVDDPRHRLAVAKEDIRELEGEIEKLEKVAKRANKIAIGERERSRLVMILVKNKLADIFSYSETIKKKWCDGGEALAANQRLWEAAESLEERLSEIEESSDII